MCESRNAQLLNRLAEMQLSSYYATARRDLALAESTIILLEKQVRILEDRINVLSKSQQKLGEV